MDMIRTTIDNTIISIIFVDMKSGKVCLEILLYIRYVNVDNDNSIKDSPKIYLIIVGMTILLLIITNSYAKNNEVIITKAKINNNIFFIFSSIQKFV